MIDIFKKDGRLLLEYSSDMNGVSWVDEELQKKRRVTICRIFTFSVADVEEGIGNDSWIEEDIGNDSRPEEVRTFVLGRTDGDFYRISQAILGLKHDLLLSKSMSISDKTFVAERNISIFRKIDNLVKEPIAVGGNINNSIPIDEFEKLLRNFPTSAELTHYTHARIARTLKDYLGTMSDAQQNLDSYLNNRRTIRAASRVEFLMDYEPKKFEYVRDELHAMLKEAETYSEKDWQRIIVNFILLIFPKYIAVLGNLHIKDFYSKPAKAKDRYIDLTLVDACGTIDVIEIKKPFSNCLLTTNKYRHNYTPKTELSGAVMQVEKYLFHLNKWGRDGELEILKKRKHELPDNFEIKVTNPKGIIIIGRDIDFTGDQKFDFEIIRRKYANVVDIMTYDDLLRRLDNIINMIHHNYSKLGGKHE